MSRSRPTGPTQAPPQPHLDHRPNHPARRPRLHATHPLPTPALPSPPRHTLTLSTGQAARTALTTTKSRSTKSRSRESQLPPRRAPASTRDSRDLPRPPATSRDHGGSRDATRRQREAGPRSAAPASPSPLEAALRVPWLPPLEAELRVPWLPPLEAELRVAWLPPLEAELRVGDELVVLLVAQPPRAEEAGRRARARARAAIGLAQGRREAAAAVLGLLGGRVGALGGARPPHALGRVRAWLGVG